MRSGKYKWIHIDFDNWLTTEENKLKQHGFKNIGSETTSKILLDRVLKPNNVSLDNTLKDIELKMKKKKRLLI